MKRSKWSLLLALSLFACSGPDGPIGPVAPVAPAPPTAAGADRLTAAPGDGVESRVTLSIVGTNDVHGALDRLPVFAGYVANLRAARRDDGAVLLIDAGDIFQGTLESNDNEGAAMIAAYNALGYAAAAIGNHELDFGPEGPKPTPAEPGDDPQGALRARAREARFPLLAANLIDAETRRRVDWDNVPASTVHDAAGVKVGIVGLSTEETPRVVMPANFAGLDVLPLAETVTAEATALRARGADVVVVTAHAGGACTAFDDPRDLSSCRPDEEIFALARALSPGLVDVIVAGHTHQAVAHEVNGIAIIESWARGAAFGRVDLEVVRAGTGEPARVSAARIHPPRVLCPGDRQPAPIATCAPGEYEGAPVTPDPAIAAVVEPALERARERRAALLGVEVTAPIEPSYSRESAMGNLYTDLMRQAMPADVAITNGGGLRARLPAGPLTYGSLYESSPFDNRFATVKLTGAQLAQVIGHSLTDRGGILSVSGVRARARCVGDRLVVDLTRDSGAKVRDRDVLVVVTSDFVATGGERAFRQLALPEGAVTLHDELMREGLARVLRARKGTLSGGDPRLLNPRRPRIEYPGERPVRCPAP